MPMSPHEDLRVVIAAENASFRFGGESSLPLHYFTRLRARGVEAWLIVHGRTRSELDALFPAEQDRIIDIPDTWVHRLLWQSGRLLPRRVAGATVAIAMELLNQCIQRKLVKKLILAHNINVVHQPTPVSPKAPSLIAGLGIAVVIGPMNGGMEYPRAFRRDESFFTRISIAMGRRGANIVNRLIPGKRDADILLVANQRTQSALPSCVRGKVVQLPENGVDLKIWTLPETPPPQPAGGRARFIFVGRLVDWKRLDLALRALAQVPDAVLEVIGDGEMRSGWSELANSLGLAERVQFLGWLPQQECAQHLQRATALLLPSIYECGGAVVLEAMATGIPAIATAWGGPTDYLDRSCGILVDPSSPQTIIDGFANAMSKLALNDSLRSQLGRAGRVRIERQYDWETKLDRILVIYREAITSRNGNA